MMKGFGFFVATAMVCMWAATVLLMLMFFLRTWMWVEEVVVLAYLGFASVVGIFVVGIIREIGLSRC